MGEQEDNVASTPVYRKRPFDSPTKKRVPLGELTNSPDIVLLQSSDPRYSRKPKPRSKRKKKQKVHESADSEVAARADDNHDTQNRVYAPLIYQHLHALEVDEKRRPLPNYMERVQWDINPAMRYMLLDWLVEVAEEYKLVSDTVYLTISYIDRFLSQNAINRNKLQLLGVSCMLIASKYEEISPPHVEDFCYMTDNTYTREEVVNMERDVLSFLNFEMSTPTIKTFLRIFTRVAQENCKDFTLQLEFLACYLAELSLLDHECLRFLPSTIAASAIFLSRFTIQPHMNPWNLEMQNYSGYKPSELKECVLAIHDLQLNRRGMSLRAIREKYKDHKFKCVAMLSSPSEVPSSYFEATNE
ncbi:hypothetical protein NMG60_11019763 [Bertholletia excelsa]